MEQIFGISNRLTKATRKPENLKGTFAMGQNLSRGNDQKLGGQSGSYSPPSFEERQQIMEDRRIAAGREIALMREASLRRMFEEISHKRFSGELSILK